MIDILQIIPLRPEVQKVLEARYRVHQMDQLDNVADVVRAVVTNSHSGPDSALIDRLPKLEIIGSASAGYDGIAVEHARGKGIPVTSTPDVLNDDVADLAIVLMIMTSRRLLAADEHVRSGRWVREGKYSLTRRVSGKRVGILGMGRIGREIAKRAETMHCTIAYHSRNPVADLPYRHYPDPVALARDSDFLIVIVPSNHNTHGLVSRDVMTALGPDGILINIARGAVVDEEAMVEMLKNGTLGGAGLDVFVDEPHVPEALLTMDNVVLEPHVGSATYETRRAMGQLVLDNLEAWFSGKPLLTQIMGTSRPGA
jgi:lactate dehydrogenase-like 2-hydroxyacid dehydrogenase